MRKQANQKIIQIIEQIHRGETQIALKTINTLTTKEKNQKKFEVNEIETLNVLKAMCLTKLHDYGEAQQIFIQYMNSKANNQQDIDNDILSWLTFLAMSLKLNGELCKFYEPLLKKFEKNEQFLQNQFFFFLKDYNYEGVQQIALKIYKLLNQHKFLYVHILFQYFSIKKKYKTTLRQPSIDKIVEREKFVKSLDIICLFTNKIMKDLKIEQNNEGQKELRKIFSMQKQILTFYANILIKQRKFDILREVLSGYQSYFFENLDYMELYYKLFQKDKIENKNLNRQLIINQNFINFRRNTNLDVFILNYDQVKTFTNFLFEEYSVSLAAIQNKEDIKQIQLTFEEFKENEKDEVDGATIFAPVEDKSEISEIIIHYNNSIQLLKKILVQQYSTHSNFKNAQKIILHAQMLILIKLIKIIEKFQLKQQENQYETQFLKIFTEYCELFDSTFTFPEEILIYINQLTNGYFKQISQIIENSAAKKENKVNFYIRDINLIKMKIYFKEISINSIIDLNKLMNVLVQKYLIGIQDLRPENKPLEKGERTYVDDYLIILVDIAMNFLYRQKQITQEYYKFFLQVLLILEFGLNNSPYNFDIKLKLILMYQILGCPEKIQDILREMDIKSVQFDTLGFLFTKTFDEYHLSQQMQDINNASMKFYNENLQQCKENVQSLIKHENFEKFEEFEKYDVWIDNSYLKLLAFFFKLEQYTYYNKREVGFESNINYYIDFIDQKFNQFQVITFNVDMKIMQLQIFSQPRDSYQNIEIWNYLGLYNNQKMLYLQFLRVIFLLDLEQFLKEEQFFKTDQDSLINRFDQILQSIQIKDFCNFHEFDTYKKPENLIINNNADQINLIEVEKLLQYEIVSLKFEKEIADFVFNINLLKNGEEERINNLNNIQNKIDTNLSQLIAATKVLILENKMDEIFNQIAIKQIIRFQNKTFKFIESFFNCAPIINQKLNKLEKKEKNEELKKSLKQISKTMNATKKFLAEQMNLICQQLIETNQNVQQIIKEEKEKELLTILSLNDEVMKQMNEYKHANFENISKLFCTNIANDYIYQLNAQLQKTKDLIKILKGFLQQ